MIIKIDRFEAVHDHNHAMRRTLLLLVASSEITIRPVEFFWPGWDGISQRDWEYDFFRELFPSPLFTHVNVSTAPGIMKCSDQKHVNDIVQKAKEKHTRVVVHTSDEFHGENERCNACLQTFRKVPLVLRQYALHNHGTKEYPSLLQIPLGYMTGMLRSPTDNQQHYASTTYALWSLSKTTAQRKYKWSFVGSFHGRGEEDRKAAVATFSSWKSVPHFLSNVTITPWNMSQIHNDTVFVLVGRGWITLDCFRIYETIIAGAIPLVVGSSKEIGHLFHYNGNNMPLVTADSWGRMLAICQNMTDDMIDRKREELARWYVNKMTQIKERITAVFNETTLLSTHDHPHNTTLSSSNQQPPPPPLHFGIYNVTNASASANSTDALAVAGGMKLGGKLTVGGMTTNGVIYNVTNITAAQQQQPQQQPSMTPIATPSYIPTLAPSAASIPPKPPSLHQHYQQQQQQQQQPPPSQLPQRPVQQPPRQQKVLEQPQQPPQTPQPPPSPPPPPQQQQQQQQLLRQQKVQDQPQQPQQHQQYRHQPPQPQHQQQLQHIHSSHQQKAQQHQQQPQPQQLQHH